MSKTNYIERHWRDAKPEDAIGELRMVARFKDNQNDEWIIDRLSGFCLERELWFCATDQLKGVAYFICQVYDAPDPGESYELIDITVVTSSDQWSRNGTDWWPCRPDYPLDDMVFFRRKIS